MSAVYTEYDVQLVDSRTNKWINDDTGLCQVMVASSPVEETIYSDANGTSASNPMTMTDGRITFYTAIATTTVDISILTAAGHSVFVSGLTPSQHRVVIDQEKYTGKQFITGYALGTASLTVVDTGFDLLSTMLVKDVFLHVTTLGSSTGVYVGVSGTTDGFLALGVVTTTGWKVYDTPVYTSNTAGTMVSATQIRGTLLKDFSAGGNTAAEGGGQGWFVNKAYKVAAATSLVYANATTNTLATGSGYIYIIYDLVPA